MTPKMTSVPPYIDEREPDEPEQHVQRDGGGAAAEAKRSTCDEDAERLAGERDGLRRRRRPARSGR